MSDQLKQAETPSERDNERKHCDTPRACEYHGCHGKCAALATQQAVQGEPKDSPPVYAQLVISNCAALKTLLRNMLDAEQMDCGVETMLDQVAEGVEEAMGDAYAQGRQDQLDQDREDFAATPPAPGQVERKPMTDAQIEKLREATFSTNNPFCPVDSQSMRKAVRAAEGFHRIRAARSSEGDKP